MSRRLYGFGVAAASLYLAAALVSSLRGPILPLYDGQAPPAAYRYVNPPGEAQTKDPALSGMQELPFAADPPVPLNALTEDAQAVLTGTERAFAPAEGQEAIEVAISPLDPETLGEAPEGLAFDGNAYRFEATYRPSGEEAPLAEPATVVLRFPMHANALLRWAGSRWERVKGATPVPAALQVYAQTRELGVFVAAGPAPPLNPWPLVGAGAGVLALGVLIFLRVRTASGGPKKREKPPTKRKKR